MRWTLATALLGLASASPVRKRDTVTAQVNFSNNTGTPEHLASGILYGVPDTLNQIPSHFYENIGYNYERAGGAQVASPGLGWIWGLTEYKNRFKSVLSNYETAREYDATFILLIHDLWGADGTQNSSAPYPGDDGDWTSWDEYLAQLFSDLKANDMTTALVVDLWNEPDSTTFWNRDQTQYLQCWGRTYYKFRDEFGTAVELSGPASAGEPLSDNTWWGAWASFVASNDSIPDQYAWHMESGTGDLLSAQAGLIYWREKYSLPAKLININEYAIYTEQVPAGSAWWISQLERIDAHGLRGNWLSGTDLHNYLASLLGTTDSVYHPNGDYQVYKYYHQNMTGYRVGTLPSTDLKLDAYATVGSDYARVLVGVRVDEGTWELELNDLPSLGLAESGSLDIHTYGFPVASDVHYGEVDGPTDLGWVEHTYSGGSVTFPVYQTDETTAYVFEFAV
ncbi:glycoside hydrolase [Aspergillus ellipticus CBS 707.79]|uniref:Glycoside hydrolase n=1 Tax=Aspergillus ellipticus CBS 707.79 TaxID=1448320 RepID=A0A319DDZ0_9EURO|nr:glycoside hydrolase [Aspergillus ellipticus CBS 707.79]